MLAQKRCVASPTAVSDSTGHGFLGWEYSTLQFLQVHIDETYGEIVDWVGELELSMGCKLKPTIVVIVNRLPIQCYICSLYLALYF